MQYHVPSEEEMAAAQSLVEWAVARSSQRMQQLTAAAALAAGSRSTIPVSAGQIDATTRHVRVVGV